MRHRKSGRKLGRNSSHRKALYRNMVTSLLRHGQIRTTLAKAKELRSHVEPVITLARKHTWSNYESSVDAVINALPAIESWVATNASDNADTSSALANVKNSAQQNGSSKFPAGLGSLLRELNAAGAESDSGFSDTLGLVVAARNGQMALQKARSEASSYVRDERVEGSPVRSTEVLDSLFGEIAEAYVDRPGGYTRVLKVGYRDGDNAAMGIIALVHLSEDVVIGSEAESDVVEVPEPEGDQPGDESEANA